MADRFRAFEIESWQHAATAYCDFFAPVTSRLGEPLLDAVAARAGCRLLDAATGPGQLAAAAAARGAFVVGLDITAPMLKVAARNHPGLSLCQADAQQLPFTERTFDAVVASFLLPHLAQPEATLAELARVLAGDGRLALTHWDLPEHHRLMGVFMEALQAAGAQPPAELPLGPPVYDYSRDQALAGLLTGAGLAQVRVETIRFHHRFASADAVWAGTLAATARTGPLIRAQPPECQRAIRAAYDGLVAPYVRAGALELPISVKLASGRMSSRAEAADVDEGGS